MSFVLLACAFALAMFPTLAQPWGRRLPPRDWARLSLLALLGGAVALELGLLVMAVPTLMHAGGIADLVHACERVLHARSPHGGLAGWMLVALMLWTLAGACLALLRARRVQRAAWVEPCVGKRLAVEGHDIVVLDCSPLLALSVEGPSGQIVVSRGAIEALEPAELAAVVHHELAHLRNGHQRYLLLADAVRGALAWLPPIGRSVAALRTTLERWADEEAAAHATGGRAAVREALIRFGQRSLVPGLAGFGGRGSSLLERLVALERPPASPRFAQRTLLYGAMFSIAGPAVVALTSC